MGSARDCKLKLNFVIQGLQFVISMIRNIRPDEEESKMALAVLEVIWGYQRQRPPPLDELEKAFKCKYLTVICRDQRACKTLNQLPQVMAGADINTTATTEALLLEVFNRKIAIL